MFAVDCQVPRERFVSRSEVAALLDGWWAQPVRPLWLQGSSGSGRTTHLAAWLEHRGLPVQRIACEPRRSLEEIFEELNRFLLQLGEERLNQALLEHLPMAPRLSLWREVFDARPWVLWFDDVEALDRRAGQLFEVLLGDSTGPGRLVLTSRRNRPPEGVQVEVFPELEGGAAEAIYRSWSESVSVPPSFDPGRFGSACIVRVLAADPELAARSGRFSHRAELLSHAIATRSETERILLEAVCVAPGAVTTGYLRWFQEEPEEALLALRSAGLLQKGASGHYRVHREVRVAALRLAADRRRQLFAHAGAYYHDRAAKSRDPWDLLHARRLYYRGGEFERAGELQRESLEGLLRRGLVELAEEILLETAGTTSGLRRSVALGNLALIHKHRGNFEEALRIYQELSDHFRRHGDPRNLARVLHQLGNTYCLVRAYDRAIECYEESGQIAKETGDEGVAVATEVQIGNVHYLRGEPDRALQWYDRGLEGARRTENQRLESILLLQLGRLHFESGREAEAYSILGEAQSIATQAGDRRCLVRALRYLGLVAERMGDVEQAWDQLRESEEEALSFGDYREAGNASHARGRLEAGRGRMADALGSYARALEHFRRSGEEPMASQVVDTVRELRENLGADAFTRLARSAGVEIDTLLELPPAAAETGASSESAS